MDETLRRPIRSVPQRIEAQPSPLLSTLVRSRRNQHDAQVFQRVVPPMLRGHLKFIHMDGDTAVLFADSPAWLSRARHQRSQLLRSIRAEICPQCADIRLRVAMPSPQAGQNAQRPQTTRPLSARARRLIHAASAQVEDADLAEAMARIARGD